MSDYPIEDEYVLHITIQIIEYFRKLGFTVRPIPISRIVEKKQGYDWRYELRDLNKVFMLQFKRPNPSDRISWELNLHQHNTMMNKPYIFYCLPKSKDRDEMPVMLYRCLFKRASFDFETTITPSRLRYPTTWGTFASNVIKCRYGMKLHEMEKKPGKKRKDVEERKNIDTLDESQINFKDSIVVFGMSLENKKIKIFANDKIIEKLD